MENKIALIVLDGFGVSKKEEGNAVKKAKMPFYNNLLKNYPHSLLRASGKFVGLKNGQMGNSETGHMNIGAGRIVSQDLTLIDNMIRDDKLKDSKELVKFFSKIKNNNGTIHFIGLLSSGGTHSHIDHCLYLIKAAKNFGIKKCLVHVITDGRDADIHSAVGFVRELEKVLNKDNFGEIASIGGRYYAMDRDKKYDRVKIGYDAIINGVGVEITNPIEYLKRSYTQNITDEYIIPACVYSDGKYIGSFDNKKDGMMFFNFRKDRTKEITEAFLLKDFKEFDRPFLINNYLTMTNYGDQFACDKIFDKNIVKDGVVEVLSKNGKKIGKFSEPTKFPHVTYFLNGGREEPFENEMWFKVPAKNVPTFDLAPEMSAIEVAQEIVKQTKKENFDFIMANFANSDIVGHTGNFDATVKALKAVDKALSICVPYLMEKGYKILITADHGNSEQMIFRNKVCTTHSNNPVNLILVSEEKQNYKLSNGTLVDLSPTILTIFNIAYPKCYTGKNLIK